MSKKIILVLIGFFLCGVFNTAEKMIRIRWSPVYMLKNPNLVSDGTINKLLAGNTEDRILAFGILEMTRSKLGVSRAKADLTASDERLQASATDYLANIGQRDSLPNLRKLISQKLFAKGLEKRIFYLEVMSGNGEQ